MISSRRRVLRGPHFIVCLFIIFSIFAYLSTQISFSQPEEKLRCIPYIKDPGIELDGYPSEKVYSKALRIATFRENNNGKLSSYYTVFYLLSTDDGIYWAGVMKQREINATQLTHEEPMYSDDRAILLIDPHGNGQGKVIFRVNPLGTHQSTSTWHRNWRPRWMSSAKILPDGWSFEAFIPFDVLQLKSGTQVLGINFARYIASAGLLLTYIWGPNYSQPMNFQRYCLKIPRALSKWILMPQLFSYLERGSSLTGLGMDLAYKPPGYTLHLTLNPSFLENAIRERYVTPIAGERLLKETRPFFREGILYLRPYKLTYSLQNLDFNDYYILFYTRRLSDIDAGLKVYGKFGDLEAGFLEYRRRDGRIGGALRLLTGKGKAWRYSVFRIADLSGVEAKMTTDTSMAMIQYALQDNGARAYAFEYSYDNKRSFSWTLSYNAVSPRFSPELGYVPIRDLRSLSTGVMFYKYYTRGDVNIGYSLTIGYKTSRSGLGNDYLDPFEREDLLIDLQYKVGPWSLELARNYPRHISLETGEELRSDKTIYYLSYMPSTDMYLSYQKISGWFLGRVYDQDYLSLSYPISKTWLLKVSGYWVELGNVYLKDLTYTLAYRRKRTIVSAGLTYTELGTANLVLRYQRFLPDGSEIHILYGDPSGIQTRNSLYLKFIKRIEFRG